MANAVLFDMDGILYDSEVQYAKVTERVMRSLGYTGPSESLYETIGKTSDGTWQLLFDLLEGNWSRREIETAWVKDNLAHPIDYRAIMFEDIPETLKTLKENGFLMACCSSSKKEVIAQSLDAMGIAEYFGFTVSADEIEHPKPAPDIYLLAARKLGAPPENCWVYEDSQIGIEAGKRAGMKVIARREDRFRQNQSGSDYIVSNAAGMCRLVINERTKSYGKSNQD